MLCTHTPCTHNDANNGRLSCNGGRDKHTPYWKFVDYIPDPDRHLRSTLRCANTESEDIPVPLHTDHDTSADEVLLRVNCASWKRGQSIPEPISFITTVTIHNYFSLPLQAQNSFFPQILSSIVLLPFNPPYWLHGSSCFSFLSDMSALTLALCAR